MKQKLVLIVSVLVGLLAAFLTRAYLTAQERNYRQMTDDFMRRFASMSVVAVNKDLPSGSQLSTADFEFKDQIESVARGRAIEEHNFQRLIGKRILRQYQAGQVIYWADIDGGEPGTGGLSSDIKKGMRGVSINVSGASSVSGMVQPNDHVDVLGTFSFPSKEVPGEMELVTLTILQDVLVLATGKETAKSRLFANNPSGSSYSTVTLEVTPRETEMLVFAEQIKGRLSLALRNPDDIHYETTLPRVNFDKIQGEIEKLNEERQRTIHRKPTRAN